MVWEQLFPLTLLTHWTEGSSSSNCTYFIYPIWIFDWFMFWFQDKENIKRQPQFEYGHVLQHEGGDSVSFVSNRYFCMHRLSKLSYSEDNLLISQSWRQSNHIISHSFEYTSLFHICHVLQIHILKRAKRKRQSFKANNTSFKVHHTKCQILKER